MIRTARCLLEFGLYIAHNSYMYQEMVLL